MKKKYYLLIVIFLLMLFSLINNYYARFILSSYESYFIKELLWYLISFLAIYLMSKFNLNIIFKYSFYLYLLGNLLLLYTLFRGTNVNGSTSWIRLGIFSFQPSEFMKIFLILYLREFTLKHKLSNFKYLIATSIIVLIPSILTFLEPDTGAIIIYFIIFITFLVMHKFSKWFYISGAIITLIAASAFFILYYNYQNLFIDIFGTAFFYRMDRINGFLSGEGYQITNALRSISNSGLFGIDKYLYFPESATDFAFTLLIANTGLVGSIIFLVVYYFFFNYLMKISHDKYLLYPVLYCLLFQVSVNILMNIGLFPIIGITLPFLSYGGSNLLSYMILIGFLLNKKVS